METKFIKYFFLILLNGLLFSCSSYKFENVEFSDLSSKNEINLKKVQNFRTIGNIENVDGRVLKDSIFFRSADLFHLKNQEKFYELNIKKIIDLRTDGEIEKKPDVIFSDIKYYHYPAFTDKEDQLTQARKLVLKGKVNSVDAYNRMITFYQDYPVENPEMIKNIVTEILDSDSPILYHCTAGKDRTGMITAFIMKILKFDDKTILQEYLLSNNMRENLIQKRLNKAKSLHFLFPKADLKVLEKLSWVEQDYLQATFNEIDKKYGSFENYITTVLDISEEKRAFYIDKFTDEATSLK